MLIYNYSFEIEIYLFFYIGHNMQLLYLYVNRHNECYYII